MGTAGIFIILFFWFLSNLTRLESVVAWFYRKFSWISKRFEYRKLATNIQTIVNASGENLNREVEDILPYAMKIEWAKTVQEAEAFLRNGEIIIMMDYSSNQDRNLVVSTLTYLGKGLLPRARPYIDGILMKAIDYTVAKSVFTSRNQTSATLFFFNEHLQPNIEKEPKLIDDCTLLDKLQETGFFKGVLLGQLKYLGEKAYPTTPGSVTQQESRDFAGFLGKVATKKRGEDIIGGLSFIRSKIRASVMLVAREGTKAWGTEAYERRTKINLDRGIEQIYVCARGRDNIRLAEQVVSEQEKAGLLKTLKRYRFLQTIRNTTYNTIFILCSTNLLIPTEAITDSSQELARLLEDHIDEIHNKNIEIVSLARQQGIKSKIAVKSLIKGIKASTCCKKSQNLKSLKQILGDEQLEFIEWSYDPESIIGCNNQKRYARGNCRS